MTLVLTPGQQHESTVVEQLLDGGAVRRVGPGRPRRRPVRVVADKGYSYPRVRKEIARRGIRHTIPRRKDQGQDPDFKKETYRKRNVVERLFNRFTQFRRVATRYEKRASSYLAMVTLAAVVIWLR